MVDAVPSPSPLDAVASSPPTTGRTPPPLLLLRAAGVLQRRRTTGDWTAPSLAVASSIACDHCVLSVDLQDSPRPLDSIVISFVPLLTADSLSSLQVGTARVRGCFGPLRSSDQDAVLARVLSPFPVLKALAPPPGTSYLGTPSFAGVGSGCSSVSFELSLSSYGCGSLRSWTSTVVVDSRSNGTWGGRSIEHRLESFPDVTLGQLPLPVLLVISKIRIITFSCILVVS